MTSRWLGAVVVLGACGEVARVAPDGAVVDGPAVAYHAVVPSVAPVTFGGGVGVCTYTITFQQLTVDLMITPAGQVTSGTAHHHNIEAVIQPCPYSPSPPSDASYTLQSAQPGADTTALAFTGAAANAPRSALAIQLSATRTSSYTAALTVHRTDLPPPLDWTVITTATLSPAAP